LGKTQITTIRLLINSAEMLYAKQRLAFRKSTLNEALQLPTPAKPAIIVQNN